MRRDKEEYEVEVGIPLDDLSAPPENETDAGEEGHSAAGHDDPSIAMPNEDNVGLPSLFDEEELAEVGLKASPFCDDDDMPAPDEDPESSEAAPEQDEQPVSPPDALPSADQSDEDPPAAFADLDHLESFSGFAEADGTNLAPEDMSAPEAAEADAAMPPPLSDDGDLAHQLGAIQSRLTQLQNEFVGKLKYDAHKDHIIDKLHQELQEYKQDILKKHTLSIVLDVVKVADDIRKWIAYFRSLDVSQRDPVKMFRYLEAIPSDLEDIFTWHGVKPYTSRGDVFNPAIQRAIKKIPTDDSTKDKTVAKSIRPGYEWEGKIIRQEMVAVYVYEDDQESVDTGNIDE